MSNYDKCKDEVPKFLENMLLHNELDRFEIKTTTDGDGLKFEIQVSALDKGKVLGKDGRTISAMRTLVNVYTRPRGVRASVTVVDEHGK